MVELHYEDEAIVEDPDAPGGERYEIRHWRIVLNDENAALAQAAQDIAEGRNPVRIVKRPRADPWDYRVEYKEREWETITPRAELHRKARAIEPAF